MDIAINGGRVIDPLTRMDVLANVGVKGGRISAIVPPGDPLNARSVIDARGLVVAPGFINVHGHGSGQGVGAEFHVLDGITTEVTGNCGFSAPMNWIGADAEKSGYPLADSFEWLEQKGAVVNLASFVGHITLREIVSVPDVRTPPTADQIAEMAALVRQEMASGALGITFAPFYGPGTTRDEMIALAEAVAEDGGCVAIHARHSFAPKDLEAIEEALCIARKADVPLILSHLAGPTFSPKSTGMALEMIAEALEEGLKITTDCHPYDALYTYMGAPVFDDLSIEQYLELAGAHISDMRVGSTVVVDGEALMKAGEPFETVEQWRSVRGRLKAKQIPDPWVIGHLYKPHKIWLWYSVPFTMVGNDGVIGIDSATGRYKGHPRGAGSFARFLGYWVRERGACDLVTALGKTSSFAALWLGLETKGRIQVGCDADLTLFDPDAVIDRATYAEPGVSSTGIPYVIVNGALAVSGGAFTGQRAGKAIRRRWTVPGILPRQGRLPRETRPLGTMNPYR